MQVMMEGRQGERRKGRGKEEREGTGKRKKGKNEGIEKRVMSVKSKQARRPRESSQAEGPAHVGEAVQEETLALRVGLRVGDADWVQLHNKGDDSRGQTHRISPSLDLSLDLSPDLSLDLSLDLS